MNNEITNVEEKPECGVDQLDALKIQIKEEDWLPFLFWGQTRFIDKCKKSGGKLSERDNCYLQLLIQNFISVYLKSTGKKEFDDIGIFIYKKILNLESK